jgi:hypothetical protein
MKPIRRGFCGLVLLTWLAVVFFWVRSYWRSDSVVVGHNRALISGNGTIVFFHPPSRLSESWFEVRSGPWPDWAHGWAWFCGNQGERVLFPMDFSWRDPGRPFGRPPGLMVCAPHWAVLAAVSAACTAAMLVRRWRRPHGPGLCPVCGYDLRGTPERCPECGHVAEGLRESSPESA